jgi:predicted  nucleic acid-binding Zn-ribbon protein
MQYTRISSSEFEDLKAEVEAAKKQKEENKKLCSALNEEYKISKKGVDDSELDYAVKRQTNAALSKAFNEKAKEIPDCHIGLFW